MKVRLFKPCVDEKELENIKDVFDRSWLGLGPKVKELEQKWADFAGCKEAIGVNSCTAALHLALSAYKFPAGKKVLVPVMTFAATAMAVLYNRLEPVFVDIDPKTAGICLDDLDKKYDKDCVAVMPVHFGGHPAEMDKLTSWAKSKDLKVIEDCAHTAGGEFKGRKLGTWGDIGCYSFEEKKCMTSGDGGMICSDDAELIKPLRHSRWVGINKDTWQRLSENLDSNPDTLHWYYEISDVGYKYNMNDLAASIALAQLEKLDYMNQRRKHIIQRYIDGLKGSSQVRIGLPYRLENSSYWIFMLRVEKRDEFLKYMTEKEIATGVHYMPLTMHPLFNKYKNNTPIADRDWKKFVTLPLFPDLEDEQVDYVIQAVRDFK